MSDKWLFWTDIETTGLDLDKDFILEMGVIITEYKAPYVEVARFQDVIMQPGVRWLQRLNSPECVRAKEMHTANGLIEAVKAAGPDQHIEHLSVGLHLTLKDLGGAGDFQIAGSGVASFDRPLIRRDIPWLDKWFHYRPFDVGSMRELVRSAGREDLIPDVGMDGDDPDKPHRSMADVLHHLEEARAYAEILKGV